MKPIPDDALANREAWGRFAVDYVAAAEQAWASETPYWGIYAIPEADVGLLPDVAGLDVLEMGCGAGYVSAWLDRRGAKVVGLDPTPEQLATARAMQAKHGQSFPLVEGFAEAMPFPDASFDLVFSEYGGCLWADPERWVPEAARVLRPGGRLIFLTNSVFQVLCCPDYEADGPVGDRLLRPYLGLYRVKWPDSTGEVEYHLTHGGWIELLGRHGFTVTRLAELGAPEGAATRYAWADADWARKWPIEEAWLARLGG